MTAAKHALAEGDFQLAARRLVYARDAEPRNTAVLRLMTLAFWQAGDYSAAARAVRDWIREESDRPAPYRYAARIYEDMGSLSQAVDAAAQEVDCPSDASAWERLGRLRMRAFDRAGAREALERARELGPAEQGLLDLALVANLMGDVGAEVTACEQAPRWHPSHPTPGPATRTRSRAPTASPTASPPASRRSSWRPTPRCATCSSARGSAANRGEPSSEGGPVT